MPEKEFTVILKIRPQVPFTEPGIREWLGKMFKRSISKETVVIKEVREHNGDVF